MSDTEQSTNEPRDHLIINVSGFPRQTYEAIRAHAIAHGVADQRAAILKWAAVQGLRSLQDKNGK